VLFINLEKEAWRREELNIRVRNKDMEKLEEDIPQEYRNFEDQVFNKVVFEKLTDQSKWDHTIKLLSNATLKDCKIYPLNIREQRELNRFLDKHLKSGQIRPSKLPCVAPFFFVKKKGWFTTTSTRLLVTKQSNNKKQIPFTVDSRINRQSTRSPILYQAQYLMEV